MILKGAEKTIHLNSWCVSRFQHLGSGRNNPTISFTTRLSLADVNGSSLFLGLSNFTSTLGSMFEALLQVCHTGYHGVGSMMLPATMPALTAEIVVILNIPFNHSV